MRAERQGLLEELAERRLRLQEQVVASGQCREAGARDARRHVLGTRQHPSDSRGAPTAAQGGPLSKSAVSRVVATLKNGLERGGRVRSPTST